MKYEDFKDLVQNFQFKEYTAGQNVFEINSQGETFFIILKGIVSVMVRNPAIKEWNSEFKFYQELVEWKQKFDKKAKKAETDRMENYQNEMKMKQETERYNKSKTGGSAAMKSVVNNLKRSERELMDRFSQSIKEKFSQ